MRIGVNTISVTAAKGGIKTYLLGLLQGLRSVQSDNEYLLLCTEQNASMFASIAEGAPRFSIHTLFSKAEGPAARIVYEQALLPLRLRATEIEALLVPSNLALLAEPSIPQVVVLQAPLAVRALQDESGLQGLRHSLRKMYFNATVPISVRRARWTVAVSDYVARHLRNQCPGARDRIVVVPEGVDFQRFHRVATRTQEEEPRYILFVSTLFPYKGAASLLRAFARMKQRFPSSEAIRLKVAGRDPDSRQLPALRELASSLSIERDVDFLGGVPHTQVARLYAGARAFVFPSFLESFGLPPLEAMSCGVPVVASTRASVPEVVGDAALLADPADVAELASAMERACFDDSVRMALIERGYQRAKQLSWEAVAVQFLDLFSRLNHSDGVDGDGHE